jgi:hypothetical protein
MKYKANPVIVDAFEIVGMAPREQTDGINLTLQGVMGQYHATPEMLSRMQPKSGDYLVRQEDGYEYLNPKEVFERKYSLAEGDQNNG